MVGSGNPETNGDSDDRLHDCAVIGAGPGGLTAAIYLQRFCRDTVVLDAGRSRTRWIPTSHNCPGFPAGISGDEFMQRLRIQAAAHDTRIVPATVEGARRVGESFAFTDGNGRIWRARTAILATGIVDQLPPGDWVEEAVASGALRLCAICDGYEAREAQIAVYGPSASILDHALFLRIYTPSVTLIPSDRVPLDAETDARRIDAGIALTAPAIGVSFDGARCVFSFGDDTPQAFDVVYPYLGSRAQSALAAQLSAQLDEQGEIVVDSEQMTSVDGFYAVGDIVSALNQIAVAVGHAAVAATAIHNRLPPNPAALR